MTGLALLAVLPAAAGRILSEPGTQTVPVGDVLGLCAPAPDFSTADGARAAVVAQHDLLTRVALAHDLVPVRPGAVFSSRARIAQYLTTAHADLARRLARVEGKLELVVSVRTTVAAPVPVPSPGLDGVAYLRARRATAADPGACRAGSGTAAHLLADILAACGTGLAAVGRPSSDPHEAEATLLVPRTQLAAVLRTVGAVASARPGGADVTVRGPWPCYVFSAAEVCHAAS